MDELGDGNAQARARPLSWLLGSPCSGGHGSPPDAAISTGPPERRYRKPVVVSCCCTGLGGSPSGCQRQPPFLKGFVRHDAGIRVLTHLTPLFTFQSFPSWSSKQRRNHRSPPTANSEHSAFLAKRHPRYAGQNSPPQATAGGGLTQSPQNPSPLVAGCEPGTDARIVPLLPGKLLKTPAMHEQVSECPPPPGWR